MSDPPPPPPPPHGGVPKGSGLPPGKYDIFIIPPHSSGSGFLYLPSMQPNMNSFAAGFASALILVVLGQSMAPAFRTWWESFHGLGNMGMTLLMVGIGFGAWALGRTQKGDTGSKQEHQQSGGSGHGYSGGWSGGSGGFDQGTQSKYDGPPHSHSTAGGHPPPNESAQSPPHSQPPPPPPPREEPATPPPPPPREEPAAPPPREEPPRSSRQQQEPEPEVKKKDSAKGSWAKAREETRRKEEERKAKEAEQKRKEETARRLAELRAKEARERLEREKEKQKREKEAQDQREKLEAELKAKRLAEELEIERRVRERTEKELKERQIREAREKELKEAKEREGAAAAAAAAATIKTERQGGGYAFSGVGEKTSMWPNGRPTVPAAGSTASSKKPPAPTAKTYLSTNEDATSYRPYDRPKKPRHKRSVSSLGGSESSWANSHTTARTSPPPSMRTPYSTKDPDKIVISAVYLFMNQFSKTPASQLISGVGNVTDGLILRITTEGLFIDDDVRNVPQREWDVKAWTLKLAEVWCPPHCFNAASSSNAGTKNSSPGLLHKMAGRSNRDRGGDKPLTGEEADQYLTEMLYACKNCCRLGLCDQKFKDKNVKSSTGTTGEWKSKRLHVLRATVRDQDSKRYLFIVDEQESWKLAVGLQRLRRGTQVRQLGIEGLSAADARGTLEMLGWDA